MTLPNVEPVWMHEDSFGEYRSVLVAGNEVLAARLNWFSYICAGTIAVAKVAKRPKGAKRAVCVTLLPREGFEVEVPDLPREASEGSEVRIIIHREPMAERGRFKRAQGRFFNDEAAAGSIPPMSDVIKGDEVQRLPEGAWEEVWALAAEGEIAFPGGSLVITLTPAMTLIDIDGTGSAGSLSLAAVPAIATAIRWLDLGGNIGIDFPTIADKSERKRVDAALEEALADWPHERTAMNGFGFVQIIARLEVPSLLHRLTFSRASASARYLLRQATLLEGTGRALLLTCHPSVKAAIDESWLVELQEKTGKQVRIEANPGLALEAPQAQIIA
ncbi:ribonuclease E/G [Erythrobacter sp. W53]|uniref:ribonuclease E/G n=1 Tax=Erythrobacter sp. W53 TaxID=3425947 RepID=UPI003D768232